MSFKPKFIFRNFDVLKTSGVQEFSIANIDKINWIWDVSNPLNPYIVENQSSNTNFTFKVNGGQLLEYVLIPDNDFYEPQLLENSTVENQNLHSLKDIDYLISSGEETSKVAKARQYNIPIINYWQNKKYILRGELTHGGSY